MLSTNLSRPDFQPGNVWNGLPTSIIGVSRQVS